MKDERKTSFIASMDTLNLLLYFPSALKNMETISYMQPIGENFSENLYFEDGSYKVGIICKNL